MCKAAHRALVKLTPDADKYIFDAKHSLNESKERKREEKYFFE